MVKRDSNFNPLGKSRGIRRSGGSTADYASGNPESIRAAIIAAANVGGAIRFGYSRDGGAYAIGIYGDGEPYTEFFKPDDDLDIIMQSIQELFESIADDQAKGHNQAQSEKKPPQGK